MKVALVHESPLAKLPVLVVACQCITSNLDPTANKSWLGLYKIGDSCGRSGFRVLEKERWPCVFIHAKK